MSAQQFARILAIDNLRDTVGFVFRERLRVRLEVRPCDADLEVFLLAQILRLLLRQTDEANFGMGKGRCWDAAIVHGHRVAANGFDDGDPLGRGRVRQHHFARRIADRPQMINLRLARHHVQVLGYGNESGALNLDTQRRQVQILCIRNATRCHQAGIDL